MLHHIPNIISLFRIFLVIPVIYLIWNDSWESAFSLVLLAGVSDGLDGFLARYFHWESDLGATLDPMADKILLVAIFIVLGLKGIVPQWLVILIVARDAIIISGLLLYKLMTNELKINTLFVSKLNTALLIIFVLLHLFNLAVVAVPGVFFDILIVMIVGTTVVSGALYVILWSNYFVKHTKERV
ncbi:MAG TPA: CDP-alcohol phosphatidyltransferase family protein [Leucothrix mucor]|nr:CDP-alcohol phosphatidyltransferase family protein [Leucothrix mucor]